MHINQIEFDGKRGSKITYTNVGKMIDMISFCLDNPFYTKKADIA